MKHTIFKYAMIGITTGVIVSLLKRKIGKRYKQKEKRKRKIARRKHKGNIGEGNRNK